MAACATMRSVLAENRQAMERSIRQALLENRLQLQAVMC